MSEERLKELMRAGSPVYWVRQEVSGEARSFYTRVTGVIHKIVGGKETLSAELLDACGHSCVVVRADEVVEVGGADNEY